MLISNILMEFEKINGWGIGAVFSSLFLSLPVPRGAKTKMSALGKQSIWSGLSAMLPFRPMNYIQLHYCWDTNSKKILCEKGKAPNTVCTACRAMPHNILNNTWAQMVWWVTDIWSWLNIVSTMNHWLLIWPLLGYINPVFCDKILKKVHFDLTFITEAPLAQIITDILRDCTYRKSIRRASHKSSTRGTRKLPASIS